MAPEAASAPSPRGPDKRFHSHPTPNVGMFQQKGGSAGEWRFGLAAVAIPSIYVFTGT